MPRLRDRGVCRCVIGLVAGAALAAAGDARHAWAVGRENGAQPGEGTPFMLRWDGSAWRRQRGFPAAGEFIGALSAASARDAWAFGSSGSQWYAWRWEFGSLNTIAPDDQGRPRWISHTAFNLVAPAQAQYLSFDGQAWTLVQGPVVAGQQMETMQVAHVPGTEATWSAGSATVTGGSVPRVELNGALG
jgi:hypothetical protein